MKNLILAIIVLGVMLSTPRVSNAQRPVGEPYAFASMITAAGHVVGPICDRLWEDAILVKPTSIPIVISTPTPEPITGKWETKLAVSSFDDSQKVALFLDAEKDISGWLKVYRPILVLRCQEGKTEVYIVLGMQPDVEYEPDVATVRIRFDKDPAQTLTTGVSTSGDALFFQSPITLIRTMMQRDKMAFSFIPFNASPTETAFDLRGLSNAIGPLQEVCNWK